MVSPTYGDRVQETTVTTGIGAYALAGAVIGYQPFSNIMSNTGTCYYCASDGINWEVGLGTYNTSGNTLSRTSIISSSNGNAAVNWSAGTKNIWQNFPASAIPTASVPIATSSVAGVVKPDGNIITVDGLGGITVPPASQTQFGVCKVDGTTITSSGGVLSSANSVAPTPLGIGAYVLASASIAVTAGVTQPGSSLSSRGIFTGGGSNTTGDILTGTWMAMQSNGSVNVTSMIILWIRVA